MYNALVIKHFQDPCNIGTFPEGTSNLLTRTLVSVETDFFVQLQLQIIDDKIKAARFKAYGDPYIIALMSYVTELIANKPIIEVQKLSPEELVSVLGLPDTKKYYAKLALGLFAK